jgi:hypothetical protein
MCILWDTGGGGAPPQDSKAESGPHKGISDILAWEPRLGHRENLKVSLTHCLLNAGHHAVQRNQSCNPLIEGSRRHRKVIQTHKPWMEPAGGTPVGLDLSSCLALGVYNISH